MFVDLPSDERIYFFLQAGTAFSVEDDFDLTLEELKDVLKDTLWGVERGLSADSDTRAEINELISQIEARNPTPQPNEALDTLNGSWKLAYTSNSELVALLALGRLPFVEVGDITQLVNCTSKTVENRIQLSAPFSRTSLAATAAFEVRSPKLLQVQFQEGQVATPELLADFELPQTVDVLGNSVDLGPLRAALQPLDGPLRAAVSQAGALLSNAPDLKFPIPSSSRQTSTWLLNTFVDRDLRISRGDGGSVFVMTKEPALALPAPPTGDDEDLWVPAAEFAAATEVIEEEKVAPPPSSGTSSFATTGNDENISNDN